MSRSKKDKRGGHDTRLKGMYPCGCCEVRPNPTESLNRTERERESMGQEMRASYPTESGEQND